MNSFTLPRISDSASDISLLPSPRALRAASLRRLAARPAAPAAGAAAAGEDERRLALRTLLAVPEGAAREDLLLARAVAVDRDPLAAELEGEPVRAGHVLHRHVARQVDRLRHAVVH